MQCEKKGITTRSTQNMGKRYKFNASLTGFFLADRKLLLCGGYHDLIPDKHYMSFPELSTKFEQHKVTIELVIRL